MLLGMFFCGAYLKDKILMVALLLKTRVSKLRCWWYIVISLAKNVMITKISIFTITMGLNNLFSKLKKIYYQGVQIIWCGIVIMTNYKMFLSGAYARGGGGGVHRGFEPPPPPPWIQRPWNALTLIMKQQVQVVYRSCKIIHTNDSSMISLLKFF